MHENWIPKAALYELLAKSFLFVNREIVEALVSGEFSEALVELIQANNLDGQSLLEHESIAKLSEYLGADADDVFHALRRNYTKLFIGAPDPEVSPFAGVWYAEEQGVTPLLFVGPESMAIERFMRSCGVAQPEGTNEPLDHIGSMLEFLQYLSLVKVKAVQLPEGVEIPETAYEEFYEKHFSSFSKKFAAKTIETSSEAFFIVAAQVLQVLPTEPL